MTQSKSSDNVNFGEDPNEILMKVLTKASYEIILLGSAKSI